MQTSEHSADDVTEGALRGILLALTLGAVLWTAILLLVLLLT